MLFKKQTNKKKPPQNKKNPSLEDSEQNIHF